MKNILALIAFICWLLTTLILTLTVIGLFLFVAIDDEVWTDIGKELAKAIIS